MSEVGPEIRVRQEIWKSLLSVLRSYTALAQMNDGLKIAISSDAEASLDTVLLTGEHAEMVIRFRPEDGSGEWLLRERIGASSNRSAIQSEFAMQMDGMLRMNGALLEPDMAAIELVAKLVAWERSMEGETVR